MGDFAVTVERTDDIPVVANPAVFQSNRFTQMETEVVSFDNPNPSLAGFTLSAENEYLRLYVYPHTLAIKVQVKSTGYIFSSTLDEMGEHRLNDIWVRFVESAISIDYWHGTGTRRESITTHGSSAVAMSMVDNGFEARVWFGESGIVMDIYVTLEGQDVRIYVPQNSIFEPEGIYLTQVHVYPFFGAVKEDEVPGYMFLPDGSGALIRYGDPRNRMVSPFRANVYGANLGVGQMVLQDIRPGFNVTMPVFGKVHGVGQNAFLAIIEGGDNYAEIIAHTAGLITEFNWVTAIFSRRYTYSQPTTREEGRGPSITRLQDEPNDFDIVMRFSFLAGDDADYVGMALAYQDFLRERGMLPNAGNLGPMMRLEFFGGDMVEGLIFEQYQPMTPISDIPRHIEELAARGVMDVLAVYRSFASGGSASFPTRFPVHGRLGSAGDVRDAISDLDSRGVPLFFHTDYSRAYETGFFGRADLAVGLNSRPFWSNDYGGWYDFILPTVALASAGRDVSYLERMGITNIALDSTRYLHTVRSGDGIVLGRPDVRDMKDELIHTLAPAQLALYQPNAYALAWTDFYFDIPMTSTGHLFATDTVPFLQIVLRGYVSYFAAFSNFAANWRLDLLNIIELGAYPSFLLTSEPSYLLAESRSSHIFSSAVDSWEDVIVHYYQEVRRALEPVRGVGITGRTMLAEGISKTTYANGVVIIVNYTGVDFYYGGVRISAEDFTVLGGAS